MLPEEVQRDFKRRLKDFIGTDHEYVMRAGLRLLDAGWGREEIMDLIDDVYSAGYTAGTCDESARPGYGTD